MATKYERIYEQIKTSITEIKKKYDYKNDSIAFGHLVLRYLFEISNEEAFDAMTDGTNDNGIDAVFFETNSYGQEVKTHFFQFKFPESSNKLETATKREEVLKTLEGYEHFIGNNDKFNVLNWNELLIDKRESFLEYDSFDHNIWLVRFSILDQSENDNIFIEKVKLIEKTTGNTIKANILKAGEITELHEKNRLSAWPSFRLKYKRSLGIFSDEKSDIFHGYISVFDLHDSLHKIKAIVLEGNVRYYDQKSTINEGIRNTLEFDYERFHLLNNGVTIVCHNVNDKNSEDSFIIDRGSIINGAQTIGTILRFIDALSMEKREEYKKSFVYVKIIKLEDINSLIGDIVYTLNTQNPMKVSYQISNNDVIKDIQKKLNTTTEYFLQIKNNEFQHTKDSDEKFDKKYKNIIDIDTFIQCFVSYYDIHEFGYLTKTSRGALFTTERINKIVAEADLKKMIVSYETYLHVMDIIKQYRAYRKDNEKKEIMNTLVIDESEIDNYKYLNTGNFILLFAIGQYHLSKKIDTSLSNIVPIIKELSQLFKNKDNISNETKKKENFEIIKKLVVSFDF